jgi:hypothetical protein
MYEALPRLYLLHWAALDARSWKMIEKLASSRATATVDEACNPARNDWQSNNLVPLTPSPSLFSLFFSFPNLHVRHASYSDCDDDSDLTKWSFRHRRDFTCIC